MGVIGSGVPGLDDIISIRKGSLITVAGSPGVGKTTFAAQFVYRGLINGENGVYVSFAENKETFFGDMLSLGLDFTQFEKERKFKYLDLLTVRGEGISAIIEEILRTIDSFRAERLVIDSFTAMSVSFRDRIEARTILHNLLSRIINRMGCTTILIVEVPIGSKHLGLGLEEFVSDTLIVMSRELWNERVIRKVEIVKNRGSPVKSSVYLFTMENGINILPNFTGYEGKLKPFKPISDSKSHFSTGRKYIDEALGGGIPRGSIVLFEKDENVSAQAALLLFGVFIKNWLSLGKGVIVLPNPKMPTRKLKEWLKNDLDVDDAVLYNQFKIMLRRDEASRYLREKMVTVFDGIDPKRDIDVQLKTLDELRKKTGKPVLTYLPIDFVHSFYRDKLEEWLNTLAAEITEGGDLLTIQTYPHSPIIHYLSSLASIHVKLINFQGNVLLCCEKPWTRFYHLSAEQDSGGISYKLTPIL